MLFNSIEFLIFLPVTLIAYWLLNNCLRAQNILLLLSSYLFYGWWDWRFLTLIFVSTFVDFFVGRKIHEVNEAKIRKRWKWVSVAFNLGLLGFFKYYNFFVNSFESAFARHGVNLDSWTLQIILPVGISFYTFQTMSHTLDIYNNKLKPTNDFISFSAFVSFFPQLVAGPIERASNLLPQLLNKRAFTYQQSVEGSKAYSMGDVQKDRYCRLFGSIGK